MKNIFQKKKKNKNIDALSAKLLEAEKAGSYLVCLTIKEKGKDVNDLHHSFFSFNFNPDDFYLCLDEYAKLLEAEKMRLEPKKKRIE